MLEQFLELMREGKKTFSLKRGRVWYRFVFSGIGSGEVIYSNYAVEDDKSFCRPGSELNVVGYVDKKGTMYFTDAYTFDVHILDNPVLPEGVKYFNHEREKLNSVVEDVCLPAYLETLPDIKLEDHVLARAQQAARKKLLSKPEKPDEVRPEKGEESYYVTPDEMAEYICGLTNLDNVVQKKFELDRDGWISRKAFLHAEERYVDDQSVVSPKELSITQALNESDASSVTVTFLVDGKEASAKLPTEKIRTTLIDRGYFYRYDFTSRREANDLFSALNVTDAHWEQSKRWLTIDKVKSMTYRRKVIWQA